jgi:uncharacterized membrane-anchored protein YhcB (DUF1043 family)
MRRFLYWVMVVLGLVATIALGMIIINWSINTQMRR